MRSFYLPLLLLLLAAASVSKASCPADWETYGNKCYKFVDQELTWKQAGEACDVLQLGATLVSVHDHSLNAFLIDTVAQGEWPWLGLHRADGSWIWTDGSDYDYSNWFTGYPIGGEGERCVDICDFSSGVWCDWSCNEEKPFICQIDA